MTHRELKKKLYDLVKSYFEGATVTWGKVSGSVNPKAPAVILSTVSLQRPYQPIKQTVDGVPVHCYPSKTTLQVDLYTKGAALNGGGAGMTAAHENTAVDDLVDFVNFINSVRVDDWSGIHDVSIMANTVQDLTELVNDTTWDYRAMVELEIGFTQTAVGHGGIMWEGGAASGEDGKPLAEQPEFTPTPSGGRSQEIADQSTGWFEQVEIEYTQDKELKDG